jgi:hypothetical protein
MLPSRPSFATCTNAFGEIWIAHRSLGSQEQVPGVRLLGFIHQDLNKG